MYTLLDAAMSARPKDNGRVDQQDVNEGSSCSHFNSTVYNEQDAVVQVVVAFKCQLELELIAVCTQPAGMPARNNPAP